MREFQYGKDDIFRIISQKKLLNFDLSFLNSPKSFHFSIYISDSNKCDILLHVRHMYNKKLVLKLVLKTNQAIKY